MKVLVHISLAAMLLLSSCVQDSTPNEVDSVNLADREFAEKAGRLYYANMDLCRYVFDNTSDSSILMLAERMLSTSNRAYNDLIELGKNKGMAVPGSMDEAHDNFKAGLSNLSGWALDSAFVHNALQDQHNLMAEYTILKDNGNNLMLRSHGKYYSDTFQVYHNLVDSLADMY